MYTREEIDAMKKWFDSQKLPDSMQITTSAYSPNLKETLQHLFEQAYDSFENPKMYGSIRILEHIKENIEKSK
jgi:hypothetical protein